MRTRQRKNHSSLSQQLSIMSAHEEHPNDSCEDEEEQQEEEEEEMDPRIQVRKSIYPHR